jgi:hypothetical protein
MLLFSREIPDLHAASRLDPRAVQAEVANLSASLKYIEFELTAVKPQRTATHFYNFFVCVH